MDESAKITKNWAIVFAVVFVASTLRAPLTAVGPVIDHIKDAMHINNSVAGILTTIPLLVFAIVSPLVSKVVDKLTMSRTIVYSTLLLIIALIIRVLGDFNLFIIGTVLLGVAIAFGNVVLPSYVKWSFPAQIGIATGMYSGTMNFTAGIGGGASVPLSTASPLGFRLSLVFWIVFGVIALMLWLPNVSKGVKKEQRDHINQSNHPDSNKKVKVLKSKLAWTIAMVMAFQSMIFYTNVAWIPTILMDRGLSPSIAGYLFMLSQFAQVPMTFVFPILASKLKDQRMLVVVIAFLFITGYCLFFTSALIFLVIGILIIGLAMGACFSLCMTFFSIRARTSKGSIALSGFGQSIGYLIAAVGPFFVGWLHDSTGHWNSAIIALITMAVLVLIFGYPAAKNKVIEDNE